MIGKTLQEILDEKNMNVNELARTINVSNQTLYSIIKRDNMKIDFDVLLKICAALNVNVERFYSDYASSNAKRQGLTPHESKVITAYRAKPEMQPAVDTLLGVNTHPRAEPEAPYSIGRSVAYGGREMFHPHTKEEYEKALKLAEEIIAKEDEYKREREKELDEAMKLAEKIVSEGQEYN
ncbi:MAG: helix-turn-helix transcriptional regulator [Oscillospiraceae bacterium]|jgi:DNA-binding Xre family transcriptional regulator|nr:helix-turn-helix transcriptional regulator [Oscillospiraceae bacterium]